MHHFRQPESNKGVRNHVARHNTMAIDKQVRRSLVLSKRARLQRHERAPFVPPEDWHEPSGRKGGDYRIIVQPPGPGYRHVVTPEEIRHRLSQLPSLMLDSLEVVQLSRVTRKKQTLPCYGMQWGSSLYLYPIEENLIEYFVRPPTPAQRNEARMYGGRWVHANTGWQLIWTEAAIKDFYLNNILIHELGHLLDHRNSSYTDRERYAEWFAIEHGYRRTHDAASHRPGQRNKIVRRHHT